MKIELDRVNRNIPWLLIIHKRLVKDWFRECSVLDFLVEGKVYENPEEYGDPKWASEIANQHYIVTPQVIEREKAYLPDYCYFQDDPLTGKMVLVRLVETPQVENKN